MQDGTIPHRTNAVFYQLNKTMREFSVLATHQSMPMVSISLLPLPININSYDYFLQGFEKDQVHRQQFDTIVDLKAAIQNKISIIEPTVLESVVTSFENRLDKIIKKKGTHLKK